jgi:acetyl-CoA carboxylase biotin carboxyl carrier protein
MQLSDADVREILRIIDESHVEELRIEVSGFSLHVRKTASTQPPLSAGGGEGAHGESAAVEQTSPAAASATAEPTAVRVVEAPMLGTFYRAQSPGEPPFTAVGEHVSADSVVCLIEVMKLMNHVQAGIEGTVVEVCAQDGELVEYGQPLLRIAPEP